MFGRKCAPYRHEANTRRCAVPSRIALLSAGLLASALLLPADPASARTAECGPAVRVPGAEHQVSACLGDLTTTGTLDSGHTVQADWAGLTAADLPAPSGVPGTQIDGYFPDGSTTNTNHGWNHDAQFVLRLPQRWNGGLVVTGTPGNRRQYANDRAIADQVLAAGYAFAATDKGNTGAEFHTDGERPGDAIVEWNDRVTQLAVAAKLAAWQHYGRPPSRTLAAGLSNGGYLVRWQLENRPWLYDGGIDWEGTLWTQRDNLLTFLPLALRGYPAGDESAVLAAGFAPGSQFLWDYHHRVYWNLTQRIYREELDPGYDGARQAGIPFCDSGTEGCDADYHYVERPAEVHRAVERIALTGRIGKPLITLHGTLDALLPISRDSDVYARMVAEFGRAELHRYYRIDGGNHADGLVDRFPDRLRPLAPCFRTAFVELESRLDGSDQPHLPAEQACTWRMRQVLASPQPSRPQRSRHAVRRSRHPPRGSPGQSPRRSAAHRSLPHRRNSGARARHRSSAGAQPDHERRRGDAHLDAGRFRATRPALPAGRADVGTGHR
jgi:hypothetical protein